MAVQSKQINPLLAAYLQSLAKRPILTKAVTSGILSFVSEIVAGQLVKSPAAAAKDDREQGVLDIVKRNHKAFKLAAYGFFVSAPLGHTLLALLQKAFAGKTSSAAKILQIVASNLLISPIQMVVYISAMAVIGGAKSSQAVLKALQLNFWPVLKLSWIISTVSMAFAQRFLAPELWVPFFTTVSATAGCYINVQTKRKALAAQAKADAADNAKNQ